MAKPCTPHLIPQAEQFFKIETVNVNAFLLDGHTARFLSRERKWGGVVLPPAGGNPLRTRAEKGAFYGLYNESHCQNPL